MHDIIAFNLLRPLFFLLFFGGSIVHKTEFIFVVNGKFVILYFPVCLEEVVYNLLSSVWRSVPDWRRFFTYNHILTGREWRILFRFYWRWWLWFFIFRFSSLSLNKSSDTFLFQIVKSKVSDHYASLLLLLVIVELKNRAT